MVSCFALCLLFAVFRITDEQSSAPNAEELLQFYANGRSLLLSGEVVTQTLRVESADQPERIHQEITGESVILFDFDRSLFRADTSEDWEFIEGPGFDALAPMQTGASHILTPLHTATKSRNGLSIHVAKPSVVPIFLQNVRISGLVLSVEAKSLFSLESGVEYLQKIIAREGNRTTVQPDGESYVLVTDVTPVGPPMPMFMRRSTWFDPEMGWVPTRLLQQRLERVDGEEKLLCTQNELTVSWVEVSGVYVPASLLETTYLINGADNSTAGKHEISTTFSWKRVNEELNSEEFEVSSLDVPNGSHLIYDSRSGEKIIVQHPIVDRADVLKELIAENQDDRQIRSFRSNGIAIAGLFVVLAGILFVIRRKARS